jgi:Fe-S-cluster containining protein
MDYAARVLSTGDNMTNGSEASAGIANLMLSAVAELDRQVERGSFFTQAVFQRGFSRLEQVETLLTRLVDVLAVRGAVKPEELGFAVTAVAGRQPEEPGDSEVGDELPPAEPGEAGIGWPTVALRVDDTEATAKSGVAVDCAARMHVCQAVCCRLKFPLSCDEVDSGAIKWDLGHPYVIRHESNGYCTHNDTTTGCCRIYEDRPGVCRRYSCAGDTRIWSDFENMVLNQEWIDAHLAERDIHVSAVIPSMEEASKR